MRCRVAPYCRHTEERRTILSTDVQTKVGTFIWHENNSTDAEKAKSFYTELLGWQTEEWPGEMQYTKVRPFDADAVASSAMRRRSSPSYG